jgi:hypothetical protein
MRGLAAQVSVTLPQQTGPSTFREARRRMDRRFAVRRLAWPRGVSRLSQALRERVATAPDLARGSDVVAD